MEAVRDGAAGLVQHGQPSLDRPVAGQSPVVEAQRRGSRRLEVVGALVAEVVLGRLERLPVGGGLDAVGFDGHRILGDAQQLLDDLFRPLVVALSESMVPDLPLGVDDVESRPVSVVEGLPDRVVVVDRDRIVDPHLLHGPADVVEVVLERELGRVHADHDQAVIPYRAAQART